MIGFMSTSLNVVNIAVSFFTETKRSATLRRSIDIFSRVCSRVPPQPCASDAETPAVIAATTSCFVMRPSFPVPAIFAVFTLFSAITFAAAGEGVPFA